MSRESVSTDSINSSFLDYFSNICRLQQGRLAPTLDESISKGTIISLSQAFEDYEDTPVSLKDIRFCLTDKYSNPLARRIRK